MTLELIEDAKGDPRNAVTLAIAADLAYYSGTKASLGSNLSWGSTASLIAVGNTQVYIATNDEHIVAAFRGTEAPTTLKDCATGC